jgi:hypothetical protein
VNKPLKYRYGGREFTLSEIKWIKQFIETNKTLNRTNLSRKVCENLNWCKPDGGYKEVRCRVAMLEMEKKGLIHLPQPMTRPQLRNKKILHTPRTDAQEVIQKPVHELGELRWECVLDREKASLWNEYVDRYHYLGHKTLPGNQMRYLIYANDRLVALLGFGACAWKTAPRDNYIGWTALQREKNLYLVINNARFLILPWIRSKNLASKLLATAAKRLPDDWFERYGFEPVLLETFVEIPRFTGICYKATNWVLVGRTLGRGKWDTQKCSSLPKKDIWLFPLRPNFKAILCS